MIRPVIDFAVCQACSPCKARAACRTRAIVQIDHGDPPYIALDRCSGCSKCVFPCAFQAIAMRQAGGMVAGFQGLHPT